MRPTSNKQAIRGFSQNSAFHVTSYGIRSSYASSSNAGLVDVRENAFARRKLLSNCNQSKQQQERQSQIIDDFRSLVSKQVDLPNSSNATQSATMTTAYGTSTTTSILQITSSPTDPLSPSYSLNTVVAAQNHKKNTDARSTHTTFGTVAKDIIQKSMHLQQSFNSTSSDKEEENEHQLSVLLNAIRVGGGNFIQSQYLEIYDFEEYLKSNITLQQAIYCDGIKRDNNDSMDDIQDLRVNGFDFGVDFEKSIKEHNIQIDKVQPFQLKKTTAPLPNFIDEKDEFNNNRLIGFSSPIKYVLRKRQELLGSTMTSYRQTCTSAGEGTQANSSQINQQRQLSFLSRPENKEKIVPLRFNNPFCQLGSQTSFQSITPNEGKLITPRIDQQQTKQISRQVQSNRIYPKTEHQYTTTDETDILTVKRHQLFTIKSRQFPVKTTSNPIKPFGTTLA